jgi:hypothetical protein
MKCPVCGRFIADVAAQINYALDIIKVEGICRKHGVVQPEDWEYEDFAVSETVEVQQELCVIQKV